MTHFKHSLWFPFAVVFFEIATYLANDMYLPGLPALMKDFNISQRLAQDTLLYWFLGSASMQLLMGPLSDRYGRKIIMIFGVLCYTASSLACAFTGEIVLFLISRFIQGCAVCSVVVAGYSAIHESYDTKMAIKIISIMGSVVILAPAFGPILGAIVIEFSQWRTIFIILGACGFISLVLLSAVMPQTQKEKFPLHLGVIFKDYWKITTRKSFLLFTLPFCFMFLSLICWVVESPFVLINHYQQNNIQYGLIQLYVFGGFTLGAQITGFLVSRIETVLLIRAGILVALLGAMTFCLLSYLQCPLYTLVIAMTFAALGMAMTFGPLSRFAIEVCEEPMGRRMAMFSSYMSFFGVISTAFVTFLDRDTMFPLALMITIGISISFLILFLFKIPKVDARDTTPHLI